VHTASDATALPPLFIDRLQFSPLDARNKCRIVSNGGAEARRQSLVLASRGGQVLLGGRCSGPGGEGSRQEPDGKRAGLGTGRREGGDGPLGRAGPGAGGADGGRVGPGGRVGGREDLSYGKHVPVYYQTVLCQFGEKNVGL
jgi:hypothetical protein